MPIYGQVVVGPPGSGKTTYCDGMQQYLRLIGRETLVVNLDPANERHDRDEHDCGPGRNRQDGNDNAQDEASEQQHDNCNEEQPNNNNESHLPYDVLLDASEEIINLSTVMSELNLGPNGGLIYCLEYMHHHIDTLVQMIQQKISSYMKDNDLIRPPYLLFDFPGQVELYTHNTTIQNILATLIKAMDMRLVSVQLVDVHCCTDVHKFISAALLSTTTMLRLELPAVNILSKVDLLGSYNGASLSQDEAETSVGSIPFNLDFFMDCHELHRLLPYLHDGNGDLANDYTYEQQQILEDDEEYQSARSKTRKNKFNMRHYKLHEQLTEVVDDYSLLNFTPLNISDAESVGRVVARIDKCNGYIFTGAVVRRNHGNRSEKGLEFKEVENNESVEMFKCAMQTDSPWGFEQISDIQEKYMGLYQDDVPELQNKDKSKK